MEKHYTHKHHIIPKHFGGSDAPDNISVVTVDQHAAAHKFLYEKYGKWEDKIAYLGLSGRISKEEVIRRVNSEAHKGKKPWLGRKHSEESKRKMSESWKGRKISEDTKRKMSESKKGAKNSFYGKKHSEETLEKLRTRVVSEETKARISQSKTGHKMGTDTRKNMSEAHKGKKHTKETRERMSEVRKEYWRNKKANG